MVPPINSRPVEISSPAPKLLASQDGRDGAGSSASRVASIDPAGPHFRNIMGMGEWCPGKDSNLHGR